MTQIREATQESKVTIEVEMLYCIEHGQMVKACEGVHETVDGETCDFPKGFAHCPPPEFPEAVEVGEDFFNGDWAAQPDEPSETEYDEWGEERED